MNKLIDKLNSKIIKSRFTDCLVYFVDDIDQITEHELECMGYFVVSDGITMIDFKDNSEDDISNMYGIMKHDNMPCNLGDFYSENGFFDNNSSEEKLLKTLDVFKNR
ncbi:hypothetical protein [Flavobacterium sp. W22_SRS_FP1]|uniref:hypothetical protein n=1 Tax=Flavobacterium sp. W22_SRS_FP1 TaxID=3240276 RepID=UPI003F8D9E6A